ncbi:MAG: hypothetical protein SGI77_17245 [Pirellulaceae bacterium]|nr:hypothetical protein [Pirellulaceae bacterium]
MPETIADLVRQDPDLQAELKALLDEQYLATGIFHPEAFLVDLEKIKGKWKKRKKDSTRNSMLAVGVGIYNQWFAEVFACVATGEDPRPSKQTLNWLSDWEKFVEENYPNESEELQEAGRKIGQYLEFMNRKSQGF